MGSASLAGSLGKKSFGVQGVLGQGGTCFNGVEEAGEPLEGKVAVQSQVCRGPLVQACGGFGGACALSF